MGIQCGVTEDQFFSTRLFWWYCPRGKLLTQRRKGTAHFIYMKIPGNRFSSESDEVFDTYLLLPLLHIQENFPSSPSVKDKLVVGLPHNHHVGRIPVIQFGDSPT